MYNKQYSKQWYQQNKERILQQEKERREADPEKYKQKARKYFSSDEAKQKAKEWRANNKERRNEQQKEYYQRNKEKCLEHKRDKYNKDRSKQINIKMKEFKKYAKRHEYRPIPGKEGSYIFDSGRVWNGNSYKFTTPNIGKREIYIHITHTTFTLHRLLAMAFDDRTPQQLKGLDCHHLDVNFQNNKLNNLVFMDDHLHDKMHRHLSQTDIKKLGAKVKHLRGSEKTKQFEQLVREQLMNKIIDIL